MRYSPTLNLADEDAKPGKRVYRRSHPEEFGVIVDVDQKALGWKTITVLYKSGRRSKPQLSSLYGDFDRYLKACRQIQQEADKVEDDIHAFEREMRTKGKLP